MFHRSDRLVVLLTVLATWCAPSAAWAGGNLLQNGGFDTPTPGLSPPNYPTSISGANAFGASSANDWNLFNSRDATTSTELLTSTDPLGSGFMIHLTTTTNDPNSPVNSFFNGLQQGFATQSGPTTFSVDVFVLSGPVTALFFAGNGGTPILASQTFSTTTNGWETLTGTAPAGTNPNLLVLDSYSISGLGEFYADNASVTSVSVPEPASGLLALIGLSASALWAGKARRRRERRDVTRWARA